MSDLRRTHITRGSRRAAFTLVELLVVIGIIALLISILLPSLAKARGTAMEVACSSNLRQIGQEVYLYAGSNRGRLPTPVSIATDGTQLFNWGSPLYSQWYQAKNQIMPVSFGLLDPQFVVQNTIPFTTWDNVFPKPMQKIFICPADTDTQANHMQKWLGNFQFFTGPVANAPSYFPFLGWATSGPAKASLVDRPRDIISCKESTRAVIAECQWFHGTIDGSIPRGDTGALKSRAPLLFLDGHVAVGNLKKYYELAGKPINLPLQSWMLHEPQCPTWAINGANGFPANEPKEWLDSLGD